MELELVGFIGHVFVHQTVEGFEAHRNLLQTLGIIGQMPLDWPYTIQWSFSFLDFFAFEISDFGFACLVGPDPLVQYSVQTAFVPARLLDFQ